jgi:hypothetical protein
MPPANRAKRATSGYSPLAGKGFTVSAARAAAKSKPQSRKRDPFGLKGYLHRFHQETKAGPPAR